jgi:hypothetical protein
MSSTIRAKFPELALEKKNGPTASNPKGYRAALSSILNQPRSQPA